MSTPSSTSSGQPRRSALRNEDPERTPPMNGLSKAVQITEPESQSSEDLPQRKQFPAGLAKRLSGRASVALNSSRASLMTQNSTESLSLTHSPAMIPEDSQAHHSYHRHHVDQVSHKLLSQVADWLEHERVKKASKTSKMSHHRRKSPPKETGIGATLDSVKESVKDAIRPRAASISSDSSDVSFDRLQRILEDGMSALGFSSIPKFDPRLGRKHSKKHHHRVSLHKAASSDTECFEGDVVVPACDVFLDNSKTLSLGTKTPVLGPVSSRKEEKERKALVTFKNEIIRLAHTLKLKGWRRVPLDSGETLSVERLSGALTNAVYVVSPPVDLTVSPQLGKKPPKKVLLRVYGPQVEHLIDRENELSVLRRLARKKIGPRLLGTFLNGRFEEYFNAVALTASNMREPDTSKQIAKRMRELHDGVALLEEEKDAGPNVFRNWDKWVDQVEKTAKYLDKQVLSSTSDANGATKTSGESRHLVCGVEWHVFTAMVEKYRKYLDEYYGSPAAIRDKLVFAHNDTQYGNILRARPDDEKSPLLRPANEHKQLIVIDFEYAAANLPGLEFANHFSEWTYNYHDPARPEMCDATRYPTLDEQRRFIKAYVDHRPQFPYYDRSDTNLSTPNLTPLDAPATPVTPGLIQHSSASSIQEFMLDARAPPGGWREEELRHEDEIAQRVEELIKETRLWRVANSAQWVAWGIIQAKVPAFVQETSGADDRLPGEPEMNNDAVDDGASVGEESAAPNEFDYLTYAHERALFFWGDCVLLGLVDRDELPEQLRSQIKLVDR